MMESSMGLLRESYLKIGHCSRAGALRRALKHVSSRRLVTARKFQCDWGFHLMRRFAHAAASTRRRAGEATHEFATGTRKSIAAVPWTAAMGTLYGVCYGHCAIATRLFVMFVSEIESGCGRTLVLGAQNNKGMLCARNLLPFRASPLRQLHRLS